ncbi:CobW-like GTP-binding protein [Clostridium oryzae]|uniref:Uncharacterized protein n=1 Tax=Clostridium oryzae TaxID=1450648 RepID=A0A1V4ICQ8_9CLOT|nr:CobW-like GTP-binding protein [Clostridium oryzae]OPJ57761.1 hypothetical protein CLORY_39370 [Clostridium oryzae]
MTETHLMNELTGNESVAIIGLEKNVGKTTVLNYIIRETRDKLKLGLTSIGRDGEDTDRVTKTHKPRIYVQNGTYIATAKQCLFNGDITKEIIETTGINTPMGEVIIVRALSDGFIELGGPSISSHMSYVCKKLLEYGSEMVLIDGAMSRKTLASPTVAQAAILSTGAALGRNINSVIEKTKNAVELLSIKQESSKKIIEKSRDILNDAKIGFIYKDGSTANLDLLTALDAERQVITQLKTANYVVIKGVLSDRFLENIMKASNDYKETTFIVEDSTKLFINNDTLHKFERKGGNIRVVNPIRLLCVTSNPKAPMGYEFDGKELLRKLRDNLNIPVFDVKLEGGV